MSAPAARQAAAETCQSRCHNISFGHGKFHAGRLKISTRIPSDICKLSLDISDDLWYFIYEFNTIVLLTEYVGLHNGTRWVIADRLGRNLLNNASRFLPFFIDKKLKILYIIIQLARR